jgi:hypothetical protein
MKKSEKSEKSESSRNGGKHNMLGKKEREFQLWRFPDSERSFILVKVGCSEGKMMRTEAVFGDGLFLSYEHKNEAENVPNCFRLEF